MPGTRFQCSLQQCTQLIGARHCTDVVMIRFVKAISIMGHSVVLDCCIRHQQLVLLVLQDDLIEALRSEGRKQAMNRQAAALNAKRSHDHSRGARSGGMSDDAGGEATAEGADTTAGALACCLLGEAFSTVISNHLAWPGAGFEFWVPRRWHA